MRIFFRHGIVSHQGSLTENFFLHSSLSGGTARISIVANIRPTILSIAHGDKNYTFTENYNVSNAWIISPYDFTTQHYWLYWEFDPLTFTRTFGYTVLEPIIQSVRPGSGSINIVDTLVGNNGTGGFVVHGEFVYLSGRKFRVIDSVGSQPPPARATNNYEFTTTTSEYNPLTGNTTIYVSQEVVDASTDGKITVDIDSFGNLIPTEGRMWYDTGSHRQYVMRGNIWVEVIRLLAVEYIQNYFISQSIESLQNIFTGTQIGNRNTSTISGEVLFNDAGTPIRKDDRTFYTTEDQFFAGNSCVTAVRLESNVIRAQSIVSAIAAFTPVAWKQEGKIDIALYDDTGTTVIGLLLENLSLNEVGPVVVQGAITSPDWDWLNVYNSALQRNVRVGDPLWIDQGMLIPVDPHLTDPITYPIPRVPCARVLARDTLLFDQGLGGKGERGPAGTIVNLPIATTTEYGTVVLSEEANLNPVPIVITENDIRLTDARIPLPHTHAASQVTYSSNNVKVALDSLFSTKFNVTGGNVTGFITLHADPTQDMHAVTKQYVDDKVAGLIWLDPLDVTDVLGDDIVDPTTINNPELGDGYILPGLATTSSAGTGTGQIGTPGVDFSPFVGCIIEYQGITPRPGATQIGDTGWYCVYDINQEVLTHSVRTGVGHESPVAVNPTGTFVNSQGKINVIAQRTSPLVFGATRALENVPCQCYTPVQGDTYFVHNEKSWHYGDSWSFQGIHNQATYGVDGDNRWLQISALQTLSAGNNIELLGNTINVINWDDGGTIDAKYWQGLEPSDLIATLDTRYSPITHTHNYNASNLAIAPYTSSIPGLGNWTSTTIQTYAEEVFDKKASLTPFYATPAALPLAANVHGMIAHINSEGKMAYSYGGNWVRLSSEGHNHDGEYAPLVHTHNFPYDMAFFIAGTMQQTTTVGSFAITRNVTVPAGAIGSVAKADIAATDPVSFSITNNGSVVGSIGFTAGNVVGIINIPIQLNLISGDILQIKTQAFIDPTLRDVSITIVGCTTAINCTL